MIEEEKNTPYMHQAHLTKQWLNVQHITSGPNCITLPIKQSARLHQTTIGRVPIMSITNVIMTLEGMICSEMEG